MSKKKGCDFKIDSKGKPHCSSNKTGIIDSRCYIPKKNCSVKPTALDRPVSAASSVASSATASATAQAVLPLSSNCVQFTKLVSPEGIINGVVDDDDNHQFIENSEPENSSALNLVKQAGSSKEKFAQSVVVRYLDNKNYTIKDNEGGGDCFFAVIRDAYSDICKNITVAELRQILAANTKQEQFDNYKLRYEMFNAEINSPVATPAEKRFARANLAEVSWIRDIPNLEAFRRKILQRNFWADVASQVILEEVLNTKFILISVDKGQRGDRELLSCGDFTSPSIEAIGAFKPKYYIVIYHTGSHFMLIKYNNKGIFRFHELPFGLKKKIVDLCMQRDTGIYNYIPKFVKLKSDIMKQERAAEASVEVEYPWVCQCGYTDNTEANCKMCTQSKAISRIFDGYKEQWVCLRCFQINNPAPPGAACSQCGENEVIFSIVGKPARRPVRDCDMDYCRESQINSWCFKHAMNNLIKKHKYFVGEFNGAVEEHNQINVMGICKEKSADILGPDVTLQMANDILFQCGPTVNINISVALAAIEKGGYSYEVIYDPAMGKGNDIELQVNTKINQEFLSNEQLLGFLLRVSISEGDPNTNHFTVIRKEAECPGRFKYIESRDISPEGSAPISRCLDLDMGIGVVNSFLLGESMKYRVHSIVAIYRR